jgi:hypothetical protein
VISCQPNQQAQIRNVVRDGTPVSEITCADRPLAAAPVYAAPASTGRLAPAPRVASTRVRDDIVSIEDDPVVAPRRSVRTQPAVYSTYDPAPERPARTVKQTRSWQKSAVIIGSSAGAGAGLGAIMGGKKGAVIGAAVGGGGATLWDQITRRKND